MKTFNDNLVARCILAGINGIEFADKYTNYKPMSKERIKILQDFIRVRKMIKNREI